jgi:hypothetical protein
MSASDPGTTVRRGGLRRWLHPWNLIFFAVLAFALVRLGPHLGAVVGIGSGGDLTPSFRYQTLAATRSRATDCAARWCL